MIFIDDFMQRLDESKSVQNVQPLNSLTNLVCITYFKVFWPHTNIVFCSSKTLKIRYLVKGISKYIFPVANQLHRRSYYIDNIGGLRSNTKSLHRSFIKIFIILIVVFQQWLEQYLFKFQFRSHKVSRYSDQYFNEIGWKYLNLNLSNPLTQWFISK